MYPFCLLRTIDRENLQIIRQKKRQGKDGKTKYFGYGYGLVTRRTVSKVY